MNKNNWQLLEFAGRRVLSDGRFVRKFIEIVTKKSLAIASETFIRIICPNGGCRITKLWPSGPNIV